jgi:hypothetical protein
MIIATAVLVSIIPPSYIREAHHKFIMPSSDLGVFDDMPAEFPNSTFKLSLDRKDALTFVMTLSNPLDTPVSYIHDSPGDFWFEAKHEGRWKPIEYIPYSLRCGTGSQYELFAAYARTTTTYSLLPGTFGTEIRFCTSGSSRSQCSNSVPASIDLRMFRFSPKQSSMAIIPHPSGIPFAIKT